MLPGEGVAGVQSKLTQEGTLCTPVALAESVNRVDLRVVVGDPLGELVLRQPAQMLLIVELAKHPGRVALDVLGQREHAAGLGE